VVEIIIGDKGKGKTKFLITKANDSALLTNGSLVYLDKNNKHMYELSNRIRMINVTDYKVDNFDMFRGFLYGITSQNHDLEKIFLDSFLTIAHITENEIQAAIDFLSDFSDTHNIDFIVSLSMNKDVLPDQLQSLVTVAL
jgi:hypothetical protein